MLLPLLHHRQLRRRLRGSVFRRRSTRRPRCVSSASSAGTSPPACPQEARVPTVRMQVPETRVSTAPAGPCRRRPWQLQIQRCRCHRPRCQQRPRRQRRPCRRKPSFSPTMTSVPFAQHRLWQMMLFAVFSACMCSTQHVGRRRFIRQTRLPIAVRMSSGPTHVPTAALRKPIFLLFGIGSPGPTLTRRTLAAIFP